MRLPSLKNASAFVALGGIENKSQSECCLPHAKQLKKGNLQRTHLIPNDLEQSTFHKHKAQFKETASEIQIRLTLASGVLHHFVSPTRIHKQLAYSP